MIVVGNIARCIIFGVPRLPIRPSDERPPAMYGHFCLVPRVSVHDRYYCTSLHNLMYYLLDQHEDWGIHQLNFPCDFAQHNLKPNICNYSVTLVTLKGITYYITCDLLFIEDKLQIWSRSDE